MKNLILILSFIALTGCAKGLNYMNSQGGLISTTEDYIVVNYSGGKIMDVWKLKDVIVDSPQASDGWVFTDQKGNSVFVGGDAKVVRLNDKKNKKELWDSYHEYHMEFESQTYREKFSLKSY